MPEQVQVPGVLLLNAVAAAMPVLAPAASVAPPEKLCVPSTCPTVNTEPMLICRRHWLISPMASVATSATKESTTESSWLRGCRNEPSSSSSANPARPLTSPNARFADSAVSNVSVADMNMLVVNGMKDGEPDALV